MTTWDQRFAAQALHISTWSKDPNKKVGCVIVDADHNQLSGGYNGFPRGVRDDLRLNEKVTKLMLIVHAEANAVAGAARNGHSLKGGAAYITAPPCTQCAALLIQAGIRRVIFPMGDPKSSWAGNVEMAKVLLNEAGVAFLEFDPEDYNGPEFE